MNRTTERQPTRAAPQGAHVLEYHGWLEASYRALKAGQRRGKTKGGGAVDFPKPSKSVTGIHFGVMQTAGKEKFSVVRVRRGSVDLVLDCPVPLDPARHSDGKGVGPNGPPTFGDESARRLLLDLAKRNPEQADALAQVAAAIGGGESYVAGVAPEEIDHVFRWSQVLTSDQYVSGLERIASTITELQRRILESQYYSPAHTAYATQLAQSACVKGGHPVVNLQYGRLGHRFMDANGYSPDQRHDATPRWWSAFSLGHHTREGFIWEMLPEVVEALETLGWVTPGVLFLDDESPLQEPLREGGACKVVVNAFERNPVARRLCIEHHGPRCAACGFDFGTTYGPVGKGFIHVHHVIPLAQIQREYVVDPIRDLIPVCANCHAVIHLGRACRTIDQVRELVEKSRKGKGAA